MKIKCPICGVETTEFKEGPGEILVCLDCYNKIEEEKKAQEAKEMEKVIDITDKVAPAEEAAKPKVKCEIVVGITENKDIYFNIGGDDADIVTAQGLAEYALRRVKQIWDQRDYEIAMRAQAEAVQAQAEAQAAAEAKE